MAEPEEALPPEVWTIAALKELLVAQQTTNTKLTSMENELITIREGQEKSKIHLKYEIDLSTAHTNLEVADFEKMNVEIDSIHVMPVPSDMDVKLRGITDEVISLETGDDYTLSNHLITRILVTNSAGSGTATIHVYGR